jgi:hypothetical protein
MISTIAFAESVRVEKSFTNPKTSTAYKHPDDSDFKISCDNDYDFIFKKLSDDSIGKYNFSQHTSVECKEVEYGKLAYSKNYILHHLSNAFSEGAVNPTDDTFKYVFLYNSNHEAGLVDRLNLISIFQKLLVTKSLRSIEKYLQLESLGILRECSFLWKNTNYIYSYFLL